jgi:hypothetical protein
MVFVSDTSTMEAYRDNSLCNSARSCCGNSVCFLNFCVNVILLDLLCVHLLFVSFKWLCCFVSTYVNYKMGSVHQRYMNWLHQPCEIGWNCIHETKGCAVWGNWWQKKWGLAMIRTAWLKIHLRLEPLESERQHLSVLSSECQPLLSQK